MVSIENKYAVQISRGDFFYHFHSLLSKNIVKVNKNEGYGIKETPRHESVAIIILPEIKLFSRAKMKEKINKIHQ